MLIATLCEKLSLADNMSNAGVSLLIGVCTVFLMLGVIICVVKVLKYVHIGLNSWDAFKAEAKKKKAEIKANKKAKYEPVIKEEAELKAKLASNEITREQYDEGIAACVAKRAQIKAQLKADKNDIMAKYDKKQEESVEPQIENVVTAEVEDSELIAVITAAVAIVLENEGAAKKTNFRVRSIREIR